MYAVNFFKSVLIIKAVMLNYTELHPTIPRAVLVRTYIRKNFLVVNFVQELHTGNGFIRSMVYPLIAVFLKP